MKKVIICFIALLSITFIYKSVIAHGGEDHSGDKKAAPSQAAAADNIVVKKETQFLFGITTQLSADEYFFKELSIYGKVIPSTHGFAAIIAPKSGSVTSIRAKVGEHVHKGQVVAVIDQVLDVTDKVGLATDENNIEAELADAKKDLDRLNSIKHIIAKKELRAAEIRYKAALENKRVYNNLKTTSSGGTAIVVTAPISGIVDNYTLSTGAQVEEGKELFRIVNINTVWIDAQVFPDDIDRVRHAADFLIKSNTSEDENSRVRLVSVGQTVNQANQSISVLLEVINARRNFRPGQAVDVIALTRNNIKQIIVPTSAITDIGGKPVVFTHEAPETFRINYVSTGATDFENTVIESGLEAGKRVVINGAYQLKSIVLNQ